MNGNAHNTTAHSTWNMNRAERESRADVVSHRPPHLHWRNDPANLEQPEAVSAARRKAALVRGAAPLWKTMPLRDRLKVVQKFRSQLADAPWTFLEPIVPLDPLARHEWLVAQVGPLLDACHFLERHAESILTDRPLGPRWGNWSWLSLRGRVLREPWGTVLILAPSNYPLYLPGVQVLQALVAGNAVLWKPAPGDDEIARCIRQRLIDCGLPPEVLRVLPSAVSSFREALVAGIDRVVLTGSVQTGRAVLHELADKMVPATLELSGVDGCLVCHADSVAAAARAVAFALHLNAGETCMAPRRIWLPPGCTSTFVDAFLTAWQSRGEPIRSRPLDPAILKLVNEAERDGARLAHGCPQGTALGGPWILIGVTPTMSLLQEHWFAPLLCVGEFHSEDQGVVAMNATPYALAASLFAPHADHAERLAPRIHAGLVIINDIVAPSAHPHIPFGGAGASGFGVTRGPEGLLEMTRPKSIVTQRLASPPHHESPRQVDTELLTAWFALIHGSSLSRRFSALTRLVQVARRRNTSAWLRSPSNPASLQSPSIKQSRE